MHPNLPSIIRPSPNSSEVDTGTASNDDSLLLGFDSELISEQLSKPKASSRPKLNDLVRNLNLLKNATELLDLRLKERNLLTTSTLGTF
ncbi:hypothetical protein Trydic_g6179 [Trypoxylus dichotomus]